MLSLKKYLLLFPAFTCFITFSQTTTPEKSDTLRAKNFEYLEGMIEKFDGDKKSQPYLKSYLEKARREENWEEAMNGYKNYLHASPQNLMLTYADSMLYAANRTGSSDLVGSAYLTKGIVYFSQKNHVKALDFYLTADRYIAKGSDEYLINKVRYNIANIKYYLGFYDDAIEQYNKCIAYFRSESPVAYLNCLHSLGLSYNRKGNYSKCATINGLALLEARRLGVSDMVPYLNLSQGINLYFLKDYGEAIRLINQSLPDIVKNEDFANESVGYFYLGKSYLAIRNEKIALVYLKKVDYLFDQQGYLRPDMRESFEILIRYSKRMKNLKGELHYINRLLKADSLLSSNYKYLSHRIHKEYDTKELVQAKSNVERQLRNRKLFESSFVALFLILFVGSLYFAFKYFKGRQKYKARFEELLNKKESRPETAMPEQTLNEADPIVIRPEVIDAIVRNLQKFELQRKYLQKDLTVIKLAESFGTNQKYLSKVITSQKGKKFINYINDLKVDYIIDLLKMEPKYRNFTNKALAEEAGFSTTQNFTTAFIKKAEISPTFFITELKKHFELESKERI